MKLTELIEKYVNTGGYSRRAVLIERMQNLDSSAINCAQCPGKCCTFIGNSMQLTPVEALDLYCYLQREELWNDELQERLRENIKEFRLDIRPSTGDGGLMRKTYTCPFFLFKSHGCPIPGEYKPYGCLGFNPVQSGETEGVSCSSDLELLKERENIEEDRTNATLKESLGLAWVKEPMPTALLDIHRSFLALGLQ